MLIVAPTLGISKYTLAPFNSLASIINLLFTSCTSAPNALNPFKVWSIGLAPIEHPPGKYISTYLYFPSNAAIK